MPRLLNDQKKQQKRQHSHNKRAHNEGIVIAGPRAKKKTNCEQQQVAKTAEGPRSKAPATTKTRKTKLQNGPKKINKKRKKTQSTMSSSENNIC